MFFHMINHIFHMAVLFVTHLISRAERSTAYKYICSFSFAVAERAGEDDS